jgi:hypothetical protein
VRARLAALAVIAVIGAGLFGAVRSFVSHDSEDPFVYTQSSALSEAAPVLTPAAVDAAVSAAPEPVAANRRTPSINTDCETRGSGVLRNPWACVISYRSGTIAHYIVIVSNDGSFQGRGTGIITGCCVRIPTVG